MIPKNRAFVDEILKTLGLSINNTKGIIDVCKGLSLNDSYWVVPTDFNGTFKEFNLYENRFSEVLSLVAYTGAGSGKEPYSEFYACQIAKAMGLDAVEYDLENWKGILASKCKIFTDIDTSYI